MYAWYEKAAVCYAYLDDVASVPVDPRTNGTEANHDYDIEPEGRFNIHTFRASKWFTRGWTLQELLAPSFVKFFGTGWEYLGSKESLSAPISDITTIPQSIIDKKGRRTGRESSVGQKMSWAAGRETTRIEDKAYCLLGIFNVNMPLLYGEGTKAFIRLQEEILKDSADHSILAWNPTSGLHGVLAVSPDQFQNCGQIIPCPSNAETPRPYSMTNIGLNIQLPLLHAAEGGSIGLLDCHFEDDFSGRLGIRLRETSTPSVFCRMRTFKSKYSESECAAAKIRAIYIGKVFQEENQRNQQTRPCIIRSNPMKRYGYEICNFYVGNSRWSVPGYTSNSAWNAETQVINMPTATGSDNTFQAAIEFRHPDKIVCPVVLIYLPPSTTLKSPLLPQVNTTSKPSEIPPEAWLWEQVPPEEWTWDQGYDYIQLGHPPRAIPGYNTNDCPDVKVRMRWEELLNQEVIVLDVRIEDKLVLHVDTFELE
jgi:hypothetical protein